MSEARAENPELFRGIAMVLTAVVFFSLVDFLSKYLARYYPVGMVVWARYTFHLLLVVVVLGPRHGLALVRTAQPGVQMLRGLLLAFASLLFVWALKFMPLAESTAIAYLAPLFVALLSVKFLKERIEFARWMAILCGFIGVVAIIRPGGSVFTWAVFLPMGNALAFAAYQILTRRLAGVDSPYTSIFYAGLVGSVLLTAALPYSWVPLRSGLHLAALIVLGMIGGAGHLILIKAYEHGPASRLAPFGYSQLIWVLILGFFAFGDFPDIWSLFGIAILVASGIYMAAHQRTVDRLLREEQANLPPSA